MNIFLVGPMGGGKTTVGRKLGKHLSWEFYDSDQEIEACTGVSVSLIFENEGEAGFRIRESKMIDKLTQKKNIVLATGGGSVIDQQNRLYLVTRGTVIYLHADIEQLKSRIRKNDKRPLLRNNSLRKLCEERESWYREVADLIIDTNNLTVNEITNQILIHRCYEDS